VSEVKNLVGTREVLKGVEDPRELVLFGGCEAEREKGDFHSFTVQGVRCV